MLHPATDIKGKKINKYEVFGSIMVDLGEACKSVIFGVRHAA